MLQPVDNFFLSETTYLNRRLNLLSPVLSRLLSLLLLGAMLLILLLYGSNSAVERAAMGKTYNEVANVPVRPVGVVLGTTNMVYGRPNLFYTARIDAAAELFHAGKVTHLIVSGDNSSKYYDEPTQMKADLMEKGVPEDKITPDFAGLRTLDSMVRAGVVFGQQRFTVVSQCFQAERGIYLANHHDLDAIAFCARDVQGLGGQRTYLREYLARFKAVLDVWVLRTQPRHLGEQVEIPS